MAPAAGGKRSAKEPAAPRQKKARKDPVLAGVLDAIGQAKDLPDSCRAMFAAVAPRCLATPASERDKAQAAVVSWIEEVLGGVRARLQAVLDAADAQAADTDKARQSLEAKVAEAKAELTAKEEVVATKESSLTESSQAMVAAKGKLQEAREVETQGEAKLAEVRKEKQSFDTALEESIRFLREEEGFEAEQARQHSEALLPLAKRLGLDESMVLALPPVAVRRPSQRGQFDGMVLEQLEASLRDKVTALDAELGAGVEANRALTEAVTAAHAGVAAAEEGQRTASDALAAALEERRLAAAALAGATAALDANLREHAPELADREAKKNALQHFVSYNVECFNTLRDKAVPVPP
mmetsp:Transcript_117957/g.328682  ORF Transcript_117957/g.328682 Transcript_117957/m.328682 type:complete len:354 (+) Transcript_117957:71-1132(+)